MKKKYFILFSGFLLFGSLPTIAQNDITTDTLLARKYFKMAAAYENKYNYDSAIICYDKAKVLFKKHQVWDYYLDCLNYTASDYQEKGEYDTAVSMLNTALDTGIILLGDNSMCVAISNQYLASCYSDLGYHNQALQYYFSCLKIQRYNYGEKHLFIADSYLNIAIKYDDLSEYDSAIFYFKKALDLRISITGSNNIRVAVIYCNIGISYLNKGNYAKALEYQLKGLNLKLALVGEKTRTTANSYTNIANVYFYKGEYKLAIDYGLKALAIKTELLGDKHKEIAVSYSNLASFYHFTGDNKLAYEYAIKSLNLRKELFGENHPTYAILYKLIAGVYIDEKKYDEALLYLKKAIAVNKLFFEKENRTLATSYNDLGLAYQHLHEQDSALQCYMKAFQIIKKIQVNKSPDLSVISRGIASVYSSKGNYQKALYYDQLSLIAIVNNFNDSFDLFANPKIENYFDYDYFLRTLEHKASTLYDLSFQDSANLKYLNAAIDCHKKCDQLIDITRKTNTTQSDKIKLGSQASLIYENAIQIALEQFKRTKDRKYLELAFYYNEKNKGGVLLDALSGQEGLKFAGIPDSLLEKEQLLKMDISFYEKKLAEMPDTVTEIKYRNRLFTLNRNYDQLIATFEKNYPDYYKLKYTTKNPSVKELQKLLDKETAIRSYFLGNNNIYIFTITNKQISYSQVPKFSNFDDTIKYFRYGLTMMSNRMKENYARIGHYLYRQLFPDSSSISPAIKNMIIIPDGSLGYIPFEALLTSSSHNNLDNYAGYPYLIHRFNISYSYSANLYYRTFPKVQQEKVEVTSLNDWLAIAPVFSDQKSQGVMLASHELQRQMEEQPTDTISKRGTLLNGGFIAALPGTETETETIFNEFENQKLKAKVMLHQNANEQFIKSGGLQNYKILHFATHGFVNSEKPELSGILLDQDTIGGQDGVLYSGEIYNLQLNADLTVLSACETGLGEIKKGEGIIGLTRALLFAGSKNIIVSLWQVSDQSTSDLMIDFYRIYLQNNQQSSYSESLRQAKLNMISQQKFARPFYWSPFILIGK